MVSRFRVVKRSLRVEFRVVHERRRRSVVEVSHLSRFNVDRGDTSVGFSEFLVESHFTLSTNGYNIFSNS